MNTVVGIDASRNRSGGAKAHLIGILGAGNPVQFGISKVHVWSYRRLLEALPEAPWLIKHNPPQLEQSLLRQVRWQFFSLSNEARNNGCDVLLSTDAGTVGKFSPSVVMSRDMLSFEPGEMRRYGLSKARVRLMLLRYMQARSLRNADGAIFLTKYAADTIQKVSGKLSCIAVIPHGVGEAFRRTPSDHTWSPSPTTDIRCLYVSNTAMYKHQWMVVRAIAALRSRGHNISLRLVGGGSGKAQQLLDSEIAKIDPDGQFVSISGFVPHQDLAALIADADVFIFASSCENMPNTLLEAMASGLPIACSDRGPMPEVLRNGGVYFDPEDSTSIAAAVESIILNPELRISMAKRAKEYSDDYSWARCARETWEFLRANARN
jgi:glycosyltransferase involved in cell wall biosynthesis